MRAGLHCRHPCGIQVCCLVFSRGLCKQNVWIQNLCATNNFESQNNFTRPRPRKKQLANTTAESNIYLKKTGKACLRGVRLREIQIGQPSFCLKSVLYLELENATLRATSFSMMSVCFAKGSPKDKRQQKKSNPINTRWKGGRLQELQCHSDRPSTGATCQRHCAYFKWPIFTSRRRIPRKHTLQVFFG